MHKWIVAMLVMGMVGVTLHAEDEHKASPTVNEKKTEVKEVTDKSSKLFKYINACMAPQEPSADVSALTK